MAHVFKYFWGLSLLLALYLVSPASTSHVYVVYLGKNQNIHPLLTSKYHLQLLSDVFASKEDAKQAMLYSYKHSFSGFSALLNSTQAAILANTKEVISVFKSKILNLHTTRSWDFLGLSLDYSKGIPLQQVYGDDIIVGVFDSGIWPESYSFHEESRMRPIPRSWKGKCVQGEDFDPSRACNRKLIGARYYIKGFEQKYGRLNKSSNREYRSPRDFLGHGTHTASTAVGSIVRNASFLGFGQGIARGGAPRARLAVYKTCWNRFLEGKCTEADILAAFDDALHDGVHVITASLGLNPPLLPFSASSSDIGAFHAMQMGVSVVFSAGNSGPGPSFVTNVAPWSISVAASSIDRTFPTQIILDGKVYFTVIYGLENSLLQSFVSLALNQSVRTRGCPKAQSFYYFSKGESFVAKPIKGLLAGARTYFFNGVCKFENLRNKSALGKVILCHATKGPVVSEEAEAAARNVSASALIFVQPLSAELIADVNILPVVHVDIIQGTQIDHYLDESPSLPAVQILPSKTVVKRSPAPVVADFSSRGPSSISPDFLKPDISAPGINILAAWPSKTPPTLLPADGQSVDWNFQSGTSMSCPHVSGVVALLKSARPDWSPAAIRSALMTTAYTIDTTGDQILAAGSVKASDPFDIGAGHINPLRAIDPGLVYDMKPRDYIIFLCNIGYTEDQIKSIVIISPGTSISCPRGGKGAITNANINYPSITVSDLQYTTTIKRTLRIVGHKKTAIYFASIESPDGVDVEIWPMVLLFSPFKEEITYYVTLSPNKISQGRYDFGEIVWSDGLHYVRSPLVVLVKTTLGPGSGGGGFGSTAAI